MDFDELATCSFQVTDGLDAGCRARLASLCQRLDLPVARASLPPTEYRRIDEARRQALSAALSSTWELVQASRFDVQVLAVLMRLTVEVEGIAGTERCLRLVDRMLTDGWQERERSLTAMDAGERERVLRQWSRYFDSVFEQIYVYAARESELRGEAFATELRGAAAALLDVGARIESALTRAQLRSTWWPRTLRILEDRLGNLPPIAAEPEAAPGDACASSEGAVVPSVQPSLDAEPAANPPAASLSNNVSPPAANPIDGVPNGERAILRVSERYWQLLRSLTALEALLKQGDYEKARIIVRDLEEILGAFDVAGFFPGLFAPFFELTAQYSESLSAHHERDPLRGAALLRLYRSDLGRFLSLPLEEEA
jgi:hypothetical protein